MIRYQCDKCGTKMAANDARRYIAKLEVYAAAGHIDLDDDAAENSEHGLTEVLEKLAQADPDEIEDQTYRSWRFDLCDACRRNLMLRPLG